MAVCDNLGNLIIDSTMHSPPCTSSPLRRKSVIPQDEGAVNIFENDDDAERQARRRKSISVRGANNSSTSDNNKRRSVSSLLTELSVSEIAARVSQCIKLSAENKISIKNAFSFEMIDFMNYMIKKRDSNMTNLQVASTSLDVSTKIYGFRVDGVHTEILKMVGGLDKHAMSQESKGGADIEQECAVDSNNENAAVSLITKKKKKRNQLKIFSTQDALKGTIEIGNTASYMMNDEDMQTTDMLYQAMLPNHLNSGYYLHQLNDIILDSVNDDNRLDECPDSGRIVTVPKIDDIEDMEICPSLLNFEFHGWSAEDEIEEDDFGENIDSRFQFDLDASLPQDDNPDPTHMNYFDMNDEHEDVEKCDNWINRVENIVDIRLVVTAPGQAKSSEYSFIQKGMKFHWADLSRWKITTLHKNNLRAIGEATCRQAPYRKKKSVQLFYDHTNMTVDLKFLPSKTVKIQPKTVMIDWCEEKITLPEDIHYNYLQSCKLNLNPELIINDNNKDDGNATPLQNDIVVNSNFNDDHDKSDYCPNVEFPDDQGSDNNDDNDEGFKIDDDRLTACTQLAFMGDNLVAAPRQVNKIQISYSLRQKKIDMRQLKKSIWKCLVSSKDKENVSVQEAVEEESAGKIRDTKHFTGVYKELPNMMSKTNTEALSLPIAFISLLHLANERSLKINGLYDMTDLVIEQG